MACTIEQAVACKGSTIRGQPNSQRTKTVRIWGGGEKEGAA